MNHIKLPRPCPGVLFAEAMPRRDMNGRVGGERNSLSCFCPSSLAAILERPLKGLKRPSKGF